MEYAKLRMNMRLGNARFSTGNAGRLLRHEPRVPRRPGQVPEAM
jgi:hypothetical protein